MSEASDTETVARELKVNITKLERAIQELNQVRQDLQLNAHQVKCQIHSTVSRELEALRNREVWLLSQVDTLQNVKEEILRGQQAQINRALGSAQKGLQFAETNGQGIKEDLLDDMERLNLTDLAPEENAHIRFQADAAGLRDTIMQFGRVDSGNRALQKVFADSNIPSASLPKSFEEYDDADHHVLYKTLEEVNRGKTSNTSIRVNIPKLAKKTEEWLIKPSLEPMAATEAKSSKIVFPTFSDNISDWLLSGGSAVKDGKTSELQTKPHLTRDKSIRDWLIQIKHFPNTHDEEEDFEIVEHVTISDTGDSGMEVATSVSTPAVSPTSPLVSSAQFAQVTPLTMRNWLRAGIPSPPLSQPEDKVGLFKTLRHLPEDMDGWLLKAPCPHGCPKSPEPVEIENLGALSCVSDKNIFTHHPDDQNTWLLRQVCDRVPPVSHVCKANEPCVEHGECLSSPSCAAEFLMSAHGENVWLMAPTTDTNGNVPVTFSHIKNMSTKRSDWLAKDWRSNSEEKVNKGAFAKWFACVSHKRCDWLKQAKPVEAISKDNPGMPVETEMNSSDLDIWLQKPAKCRAEEAKDSVLNSFQSFEVFQKNLKSGSWLLRRGDKSETEDYEAEKRDLTTEKAEMPKWLLEVGDVKLDDLCSATVNAGLGEWLFDKHQC